jgi:predicted transposase YbfD/YdcC
MNIASAFSSITDPRDTRKISHLLTDIIGLTLIASIACCETYDDVEDFGKAKENWLRKYLQLPNGIPSHDTIERLFEAMNPKEFNVCFNAWVRETFDHTGNDLLHIDGKSNRRSFDTFTGKKMLHSVSVFSSKNGLSLAQYKVDEKSNEITAIQPLIETLDIAAQTVTIDAMGCQKDIAKAIAEKQAYYVLAVKDNQKLLHHEIQNAFKSTAISDTETTLEKGHGRIEERTCTTITDLRFVDESINWTALCCIICIVSKRIIRNKTTTETRYFISNKKDSAAFFCLLFVVTGV